MAIFHIAHLKVLLRKTKTDSLEKYSQLPKESILIMQYLDIHGRMTISEAYGFITHVSKPTVKKQSR